MARTNLPFTQHEYDVRLAKTRSAMQSNGIDVLIVSDPSNMHWLTGYDGWSFYVHQAVVISLNDPPFWFGRGQDAEGAKRTVYMRDDCIIGYPDHYVQATDCHPMEQLADLLAGKGWSSKVIGVEADNYYYSAKADQVLRHALSNARFLDATSLVNWQRAVKSEQELTYMRRAGAIVSAMHRRIAETIEPGMRKNELVAEIYDVACRGADGFGGDYPAIVPLLPSGADAAAPHLTWDDQPLANNSCTFFEIAGCYRRYHCPLSRSVHLGRPPQHIIDAEQAIQEGMAAGLEAAKAGNRACDIAGAFFTILERYGIIKDNRTGYSIGLAYPPDWGERTISLRRSDETVLEANMTFHFMTGLWMAGRPEGDWGLEITESIIIGETDAACLADVPRNLIVKD